MPRILIADDSAASRRALRNLIQGNGWDVCGEAEDGLAAVQQTAVLKPDLVILDFRMPNLNGLQAGQTIHAADPSIPLLLFTLDTMEHPFGGTCPRSRISRGSRKGCRDLRLVGGDREPASGQDVLSYDGGNTVGGALARGFHECFGRSQKKKLKALGPQHPMQPGAIVHSLTTQPRNSRPAVRQYFPAATKRLFPLSSR